MLLPPILLPFGGSGAVFGIGENVFCFWRRPAAAAVIGPTNGREGIDDDGAAPKERGARAGRIPAS